MIAGVCETGRGQTREVREDEIGLADELGRRPLKALAQIVHGEGDIAASGRRCVHEAAEALLQRADELRIARRGKSERVGNMLEEGKARD